MTNEHLHYLILAYLDGRLADDKRLGELEQHLLSSAQARQTYWAMARMYEGLGRHFRGDVGYQLTLQANFEEGLAELLEHEIQAESVLRELAPDSPGDGASGCRLNGQAHALPRERDDEPLPIGDDRPRTLLQVGPLRVVRRPRRHARTFNLRLLRRVGGVAAVLLIAGVTALLMQKLTEQNPSPQPIAHVVDSLEARWADYPGDAIPEQGLEPGPYALSSGYAEFQMLNGTRVLLEGPVEFELQRPNLMRMNRGRLVATMREGGDTFTVVTPTASITDLGTEIGVEVDPSGRTRSSVFQGTARFISLSVPTGESMTSVRVEAGQTALAERGSQTVVHATNDQALTGRSFVRKIPESRHHALILEADPLAYWRFGRADLARGDVLDEGRAGMPGTLSDNAHWSMGERGVRLDGGGIEISSHQSVTQRSGNLSIELWIRPSDGGGNRPRVVSTFDSDTTYATGFAFGLNRERQDEPWKLRWTTRDEFSIVSNAPVPADQWSHIAATVDERGEVQLYINGRPTEYVVTDWPPDGAPPDRPAVPIRPGSAAMTLAMNPPTSGSLDVFVGLLDYIAIFDRVLSETEIQARYQSLSVGASP